MSVASSLNITSLDLAQVVKWHSNSVPKETYYHSHPSHNMFEVLENQLNSFFLFFILVHLHILRSYRSSILN